ncbi:nuclear transport factor 2 family protein [Actinomadura macra]|uniref:nuclear transport factor 2 family protein n=1 Tax=Actinomadura macra TaxID=46164 RepID=UPI00082BF627|nr:nuclear transport factor 2 family protein [Actinomadura macra]
MPDEAARKRMPVEYARRLNEGDVDGVLDLFTDDVVFEDPVGQPPLVGREALRRHIELAVSARVYETPARPVTSMDDRFVVTQTTVELQAPTPMTFNIIGVVEVDEDGRGRHVRAFWGMTDMAIGVPGGTTAGTGLIPEGTAS